MADEKLPRRKFLMSAGLAGTAVAAGLSSAAPAQVQTGASEKRPPIPIAPVSYLTLSATEAAFFSAVADTMIPADALSPSGTDCGVVVFCDRQLASAWGGGAKMYRNGPFRKAKPEYGYQLSLTPREYFGAGVNATNAWTRTSLGKEFDRLTPKQREDALKALENGKADLGDFNGREFFEALLNLVMEGFFSDPIYGGNKDKVSWKMIGFPGLPALYRNLVEQYRDKRYGVAPQSIADFS